MGGHSPEEIRAETRTYLMVFVALAVLTIVTVGVSYLDLSIGAAVVLAMIVATIKGGLVAAYFMHLMSERKIIYAVLVLTVFFFVVLMYIPSGWSNDGTAESTEIAVERSDDEEHHVP